LASKYAERGRIFADPDRAPEIEEVAFGPVAIEFLRGSALRAPAYYADSARQAPGLTPISRLNALLNAASLS
jgi:hypothetical protein